MKKIGIIIGLLSVIQVDAVLEKNSTITYQCPWPQPEFSVLSTKPVNLLRIVPRPRSDKDEQAKLHVYVDVPFYAVVVDQDDATYLNLKNADGTGLQVDWTDSEKRPMRYTYRYLFMCTFGVLLPASDGKPIQLETQVDMCRDIDPITHKEGDFVCAYDALHNKKLYEADLLIPTQTLTAPKMDDLPFSVEYPHIQIDMQKRLVMCVYPEKKSKGQIDSQDRVVVFVGKLPASVNAKKSEIVHKIRLKCARQVV